MGLVMQEYPDFLMTSRGTDGKRLQEAVHNEGGHIFVQLGGTGRVAHPLNLPANAKVF